jgi:hypothetical protein
MNLPTAAHVIVDSTDRTDHAPRELVLLVEASGLNIEARRDSVSTDYILHGSAVRGQKHAYVFAVRRVPSINGVRAMTVSLVRNGPP